MKSIIFDGKTLQLREIKTPDPADNEALIKVIRSGICSTDLEILKGYMGFHGVIGHEFVGIVEKAESAPELVGKRVVGEINAACGHCALCQQNLKRHCDSRTVLGIFGRNGVFAEYTTLPIWNLHIVPESVPDEDAVFVEPLAAAFEILEQVHLRPGENILVIGDGRLAHLIVRVLNRHGCEVDIVGIHEAKIRRMKGFVSKGYLNATPPEKKYPYVIEASGSPSGWKTAMNALLPKGTLILKSTYAKPYSFNPSAVVINEFNIIGSRCGAFKPALKALVEGLNVSSLLDKVYSLDDFEAAFEASKQKDILKVQFNHLGNN